MAKKTTAARRRVYERVGEYHSNRRFGNTRTNTPVRRRKQGWQV